MTEKRRFHMRAAVCVLLLYVFAGSTGQAREDEDSQFSLFSDIGIEYTDNFYGLTDDQIANMKENDPDDITSGRYDGMDSLSDYIIKPRIGIKWDSDSLFGGEFELTTWFRYNYFFKNDDADYPEGRIILKNSAGEKGSITLEGNFLYGYKKKNYLSSVNDENENGNITKAERTYSAATYDEYEGIIAYRHEFIKDKDLTLSELHLKPFAGYSTRNFNSIFENRNRDAAFCGLELDLEFINKIDLELSYMYEDISSPGNLELVLFDETVAGADINDDGLIRGNAPLYTSIDRSSDRSTYKIGSSVKLTKDMDLYLGYSKRTTKYTSDNPLDIEHYNQKAYRKKYRAGVSYGLSKSWSAEAEYCRTEDQDPEDGEYKENNYQVTIKYKF